MALVACNLCGNKISTRAKLCPKCGCPTLKQADAGRRPAVKNCADCQHGGVDGEYACNLCDSGSLQAFKAKTGVKSRQETEHPSARSAGADVSLVAQIESLDLDGSLKELFFMLTSATVSARIAGINFYANQDSRFRYFRRLNSFDTVGSNLALICGPLYYFLHAIWKKGALLQIAQFTLITGVVFTIQPVSLACLAGLVGLHGLCYCSAKFDRYRKLVLNETFWW